jgi:hypothetical protein
MFLVGKFLKNIFHVIDEYIPRENNMKNSKILLYVIAKRLQITSIRQSTVSLFVNFGEIRLWKTIWIVTFFLSFSVKV